MKKIKTTLYRFTKDTIKTMDWQKEILPKIEEVKQLWDDGSYYFSYHSKRISKEEIRIKWIRHTPLMKLDDCVDNAMEEYATQCQKDLNKDLYSKIENLSFKINK